jgi:hypothetical protein
MRKATQVIGADRRGMMSGGEEAKEHPAHPEEELESIAKRVVVSMRAAGFAHLDPEEDFIRGFFIGYREYLLASSHSVKPA